MVDRVNCECYIKFIDSLSIVSNFAKTVKGKCPCEDRKEQKMTLREQYTQESGGDEAVECHGGPSLGYVEWLEKKLISEE